MPRKREEWFYGQRAYPLGYIPAGIRLEALKEMDRMAPATPAMPPTTGGLEASGPGASATQWTSIGPVGTTSPFSFSTVSGRVTALAVDPRNANVVYAGGAQGGVWKTMDGGVTWTALTDTQVTLAVGSLALDPSNSNIVYVGTGEENFSTDSYYGAGILKSTDGGAGWTNLGRSLFAGPFSSRTGGAFIGSLAVHPTNGQIVLAGAQIFSSGSTAGIYRSTDGGASWTNVLSGASGIEVVFDPSNANNVYASLGTPSSNPANGVYKSTDAGFTWTKIGVSGANPLPTTNVGRVEIALAASTPMTLYASIQDASSSSFGALLGFFKTTDGGLNWTRIVTIPDFCVKQCWYDMAVRVSPNNPNIIFAGGSGFPNKNGTMLRSLDGGVSWTNITTGANSVALHPDVHALAFSTGGTKLYVGDDGGVWSTTDITSPTVNWTDLNATLALTQFYPGISIDPTNVNRAFGGAQDNGTQRSSGQPTWEWVTCGDGGWTAIDFSTPTTVYAACQGIEILKSTSNGDFTSWALAQTGINKNDRGAFIPPMVMDPSNSKTLYFGTFHVYQTTDGAGTWMAISPDLTNGNGVVSTIAVAPSSSNTVYAGTSDGKVQVTTNAGAGTAATWTDRSAGLPPRSVTQIAVDPASTQLFVAPPAYVTFSGFSGFGENQGHVFKTINGGATWTDISGNLPNTPVSDIVVDPSLPNTLYVATDIGVFSTLNAGVSWSPLGTGLPRVAVLALKLHRASRTLRAATHGRGMWDLLVPLAAPAPLLSSISPVSATAGGPPFTLTVNGSNFIPASMVQWNGSVRNTTFVSATQLTAAITAADIATAGTAQVTVFNPAPGGGTSNALTFTINAVNNPVPAITQLAPSTVAAGGPAFTLTVTGSNFVSASVIRWNGSNRTTTFVSATQLTAAILAADIVSAGTAQVTVFNPPPGGGSSNALAVTVMIVPIIPARGTVNAASFAAGALAPGTIAAIFGTNLATQPQNAPGVPLPTNLGGATLFFNATVAVPLFFASPGQINIQLPWELPGTQAFLTDSSGGETSTPAVINLGLFSPGIFTTNSQGTGQGEILIAATGAVAAPAGSLPGRNAQPVARGDFISIYCTGLGAVTNQPPSGAAASDNPLSTTQTTPAVTIGGVPVAATDISFSGLAPFLVGLYQVNARVPADAPTGDAVAVVVSIGGVSSNAVMIAVQ